MGFLYLCLRIPKCGSSSLAAAMSAAFSGRQIFYLPHTLNLEGTFSSLQNLRFHRTRARNLLRHYGTADIEKVYALIASRALLGDIITGGHIDFPSVRDNIPREVKAVTIFREPVERCRSEYEYLRHGYRKKTSLSRFDAAEKQKAAGRYGFRGYLDFLLEHPGAYGDLAARYLGWEGEEDLAPFFARHVFHSGVLERVDAFARGLAQKLGRPIPFPHENATERRVRSTVAQSERSRIERLSPRDFALYEWQLEQLPQSRRGLAGSRAPTQLSRALKPVSTSLIA
jgi:hypothetical protein